jgi:hypothetical protein
MIQNGRIGSSQNRGVAKEAAAIQLPRWFVAKVEIEMWLD